MGISLNRTLGHLDRVIGRGRLFAFDVILSLDPEHRVAISQVYGNDLSANPDRVFDRLKTKKLLGHWSSEADAREDIITFVTYRDPPLLFRDLYSAILLTEYYLHDLIRQVLQEEYGTDKELWWGVGVPDKVRKNCTTMREDEKEYACHPFDFTYFRDLWEIVKKEWRVFEAVFLAKGNTRLKGELQELMNKVGHVRNLVMHPVRGIRCIPDEALDRVSHLRWWALIAFYVWELKHGHDLRQFKRGYWRPMAFQRVSHNAGIQRFLMRATEQATGEGRS